MDKKIIHPEWFTDPAPIWNLLNDAEKNEIAQARLDMKIANLKEQVNQINQEIKLHQRAQEMIKQKK